MKRVILLLMYSITVFNVCAQYIKHVKLGDCFTWSSNSNNSISDHLITGNSISVKYSSYNNGTTFLVRPVAPGWASLTCTQLNSTVIVHVLDVIPSDIAMTVGDSYTYSPVATIGSYVDQVKKFEWASSDESVAKVDANGHVTAVAPGKAVISATANYNDIALGTGYTAKSVVTVSTQPAQELKLNVNSQNLSVGETVQLTATISPSNTTNKAVKWLSSNENIAQVDDNGNVTAIGAGYCSIYVKADDGSGKFDKCLIHVNGPATARGDINGDGAVNLSDAKMVVDIFVGNE